MHIITSEMLLADNVYHIVRDIENNHHEVIQSDFDNYPSKYPDLLTWLELHPAIVGEAFIRHIINYGFTNEDIQ